MSNKIKYCADCKWCRPSTVFEGIAQFEYARCANPGVSLESLVSPELGGRGCTYERSQRAGFFFNSAKCGFQGKLWEPKA